MIPQRLVHAAWLFVMILTALPLMAEAPAMSGIDRNDFDPSVKPGDDFFQYVNGGWLKRNPIPAEYSRWNMFAAVNERNVDALHEILDDLVKQTAPLSDDRRKLRDFYLTATDETALAKQGAGALAAELEQIAKVKNADDLAAVLARFRANGMNFIFYLGIEQDEKQSNRYAVHFYQSGLGLPERGYYLDDTPDSKKTRGQYREHVAKMLELLGDTAADAAAGADAVLRIETRLAEASRTPTALRDAEKNYNKTTLPELSALAPALHWESYLKTIGAGDVKEVVVGQPEFLKSVDGLFGSIPAADWRAYLRWHLVDRTANYLSPPFEAESFHFHSEIMRGVKQMQPRWKRAIGTIDHEMGEALGRLYVEKYFPPSAKQRMDELVGNLTAAYRQRIATRDWMSPATREQALVKLAAIAPKIGYPVKWRDYSTLEIRPDAFVRNVLRAEEFRWHYRLARLNQPVDRDEWGMTPPTVNAYYSSGRNEIVFPAGILQPPFFDAGADDAVNYGAIGAVIGHEMTHGFDDQGSRSDAEGNLKNWWTAEDRARFEAKTARLVKQYDACVAVDALHVNGALTLGENLADLGGVNIAYDAYLKSLNGKPAPVIDGFTGPQRFFLGYARIWRGNVRDAERRVRLRTDPHSPEHFRVLIPLSNIEAFYEAFNIKPGDAMYRKPQDRVEVW